MRKALIAAAIVIAASCTDPGSSTDFVLCVHAQSVPYVAGGPCPIAPTFRESQTASLVIEADKVRGPARTANLTVETAPTGWGVALGGATIAVPGQQTLTFTVPANATSGFYPLVLRAVVGGKEDAVLIWNVKVTVSGPT